MTTNVQSLFQNRLGPFGLAGGARRGPVVYPAPSPPAPSSLSSWPNLTDFLSLLKQPWGWLISRFGLLTAAGLMGGRLTLTSGVWLTIVDVTGATVLYYTPGGNATGGHNRCLRSTGATIYPAILTELSLKATDSSQTGGTITGTTITGLTDTSQLARGMTLTNSTGTGTLAAGTVIATIVSATSITVNNAASVNGTLTNLTFKLPASSFPATPSCWDVWDVNGKLQFGNQWTNGTTPADARGTLGGLTVNNAVINSGDSNSIAAKAGVLIGSVVVTTTAGQLEDSGGAGVTQVGGKRFVASAYNERQRHLFVQDTVASFLYSTSSWQQYDAAAGNKVEYMCCLPTHSIAARAGSLGSCTAGGLFSVGVGIDSTTVNSARMFGQAEPTTGEAMGTFCNYTGNPGIGYHAINFLQIATTGNATTWFGGQDPHYQAGLEAEVFC